jgi:hypothetical protein
MNTQNNTKTINYMASIYQVASLLILGLLLLILALFFIVDYDSFVFFIAQQADKIELIDLIKTHFFSYNK